MVIAAVVYSRRFVHAILVVALVSVLALQMVLSPIPLKNKVGALGTCQVTSVDPHSADDGSETGFLFTVTDNTDALGWIQVTSPSVNLSIVSGSSDWLPNVATTSSTATFSGTPINAGNPLQVNVVADVSSFAPSNWTVQASTDESGSNPLTCSGDTSVSVTDTTPPNFLSINVNVGTTSATVNWSTDKLTTGVLMYGTTSAYGSESDDSTLATGHSQVLSGLTPATLYHYQITATDASNNSTTSVDSTFFTQAAPVTTSSGGGAPIGTKPTNISDKIPPTISFTSTPPRIVHVEPTLTGTASDNIAVAKVEYSTDAGKDWLPVDSSSGLGSKHTTFQFAPLNLDDGTYIIMARAIDDGGNIATTSGVQVIIDRTPPIVGGVIIAVGPQVLTPDNRGVITTVPGVQLTIDLTAIGGANAIAIKAMSPGTSATSVAGTFTLHQLPDSNLWSGMLSFTKPGAYQLVAHAEDDAGNVTDRAVATMDVATPAAVLSDNGPVAGATVTAYYLDPDTNDWTIWDGDPYGQTNPQATNKQGSFQLLLPGGTYYLDISAVGYQNTNSMSFTLPQPTIISSVFNLGTAIGFGPVRLPWLSLAVDPLSTRRAQDKLPNNFTNEALIGSSLPELSFDNTAGGTENSISWLGKPTVVSVMTTWDPATVEQMAALEKLASNPELNVKPLGLGDDVGRLRAYNAIGSFSLTWLADPTNKSVGALATGATPTHYFIDRKGIIRQIVYGVLTYQQLIDAMVSLQ